jgi:hypothetical protein
MESVPENQPKVLVYEAADGVLTVAIRTVTDAELDRLSRQSRREPKRVVN